MIKATVIILFLSTTVFPQITDSTDFHFSFFAMANLNNTTIISRSGNNTTYNSEPTYDAGLELYIIYNKKGSNLGVGTDIQTSNVIAGVPGNYSCLPFYVFYDLSFGHSKILSVPKLSLEIGYNSLTISGKYQNEDAVATDGIYYALGFSSLINKFLMMRILYSFNQGEINLKNINYMLDNEKVCLGLY